MDQHVKKHCSGCGNTILPGGIAHGDEADPTKTYCSPKCFYEYILTQEPRTLHDKNVVWPLFELADVPDSVKPRIMQAFDEWLTLTGAAMRQKRNFNDVFFAGVIRKHRLGDWQHVLIILLRYSFKFM